MADFEEDTSSDESFDVQRARSHQQLPKQLVLTVGPLAPALPAETNTCLVVSAIRGLTGHVTWARDSTFQDNTSTAWPVAATCEYPDDGSDDDECDTIFVKAYAVPVAVLRSAPPKTKEPAPGWRPLGDCSLDCIIQSCSGPEQKRASTLKAADADRRLTFSLYSLQTPGATPASGQTPATTASEKSSSKVEPTAPPPPVAVSPKKEQTVLAQAVAPTPSVSTPPVVAPSPPRPKEDTAPVQSTPVVSDRPVPFTPALDNPNAAPVKPKESAVEAKPKETAAAVELPKPTEPTLKVVEPIKAVEAPLIPSASSNNKSEAVDVPLPATAPSTTAPPPAAATTIASVPNVVAMAPYLEHSTQGTLTFSVQRAVNVPRMGSAAIKTYIAVERRIAPDVPASDLLFQSDVVQGESTMTFWPPQTAPTTAGKTPTAVVPKWCRVEKATIATDGSIDASLHVELREKRVLKDPALARGMVVFRVPVDKFRTQPYVDALSWRQRVSLSGDTHLEIVATFISDKYQADVLQPLAEAWSPRPANDSARFALAAVGVALTVPQGIMGDAKRRFEADYSVKATIKTVPVSQCVPALVLQHQQTQSTPQTSAAQQPPAQLTLSSEPLLQTSIGVELRQCFYDSTAAIPLRPEAVKMLPLHISLEFTSNSAPVGSVVTVTHTLELPVTDSSVIVNVPVPLVDVAGLGRECTANIFVAVTRGELATDAAVAAPTVLPTNVELPVKTSGTATSMLGLIATTAVEPVVFPASLVKYIDSVDVSVSTQVRGQIKPAHKNFKVDVTSPTPTSDVSLVDGGDIPALTTSAKVVMQCAATVSARLKGGLILESTITFDVAAASTTTGRDDVALTITGRTSATAQAPWTVILPPTTTTTTKADVCALFAVLHPLSALTGVVTSLRSLPTRLASLVAPATFALQINVLEGAKGSILMTVDRFWVSPGSAARGIVSVQPAGTQALAVAFDPTTQGTAGRVLVLPAANSELEISVENGAHTRLFRPWPTRLNTTLDDLPCRYRVAWYVNGWGVVAFDVSRAQSSTTSQSGVSARADYCPVLPDEGALVCRVLPTVPVDQVVQCTVGVVAASTRTPVSEMFDLGSNDACVILVLVSGWRTDLEVAATSASTAAEKPAVIPCSAAVNSAGTGFTALANVVVQWRHGRAGATPEAMDAVLEKERRAKRALEVENASRSIPSVKCDFAVQTAGTRDYEPPSVISATAVTVLPDVIMVAGGRLPDGSLTRQAAIYRPRTRAWQSVECPLGSTDRYSHVAVGFEGDVILHGGIGIGGFAAFGQRIGVRNDVWRFDALSASWQKMETTSADHPTHTAPPELHRARHAAVTYGRSMLVYGGDTPVVREVAAPSTIDGALDGDGVTSYVLDTKLCDGIMLALDLVTFRWTVHSPQPAPEKFRRAGHSMVLVGSETILIFGGVDVNETATDTIVTYNVNTKQWALEDAFGAVQPPPMVGHSAAVVNIQGRECMLVLSACRAVCYLYDPSTSFWKLVETGPRGLLRRNNACVAVWHRNAPANAINADAPFASVLCFGGEQLNGRPARNAVALLTFDDDARVKNAPNDDGDDDGAAASSTKKRLSTALRAAVERPAPSPVVAPTTLPVERLERAVQRLSRPHSAVPEPKPIDRGETRKLSEEEQERVNSRLTQMPARPRSAHSAATTKASKKLSTEEVVASAQRLSSSGLRQPPKPVVRSGRKLTREEMTASGARLTSTRQLALEAAYRAHSAAAGKPAQRTSEEWSETVARLYPDPPGVLSSGQRPVRR